MNELLKKFIDVITSAYGNRVVSIILYGSQASISDAGKGSDHNLLIILDEVRYEDLCALEKAMRKWVKAGNPPPLLFSKTMFERSSDVFPVEFLDMKDNRKVLSGTDPLQELEILDKNLRHECEYELKSALLKLRQGYMASSGDPKVVSALITSSVSSLVVIFRQVIRLLGKVAPKGKRETLTILGKMTDVTVSVFEDAMLLKHGEKKLKDAEIDNMMGNYLRELERVVDIVDKLEN